MGVILPERARQLMGLLQAHGFEAYVVGGCVRDSLRGITPHDWDICTSATPEQMTACFQGLRFIETGVQHGTLTVLADGVPFEVTTYRVDGVYLDNRRPETVAFVSSLCEDLARRDFTMNAMAYNEEEGLVDPYGGEEDLKKGLIRCVGEPDRRFNEDALRMMRALRFAAVFGFRIHEATALCVHQNKDLLRKIAAERLRVELDKLLCGPGAVSVLRDYSDVLAVFIPELLPMLGFEQENPWHSADVWEHTLLAVGAVPAEVPLRLTMLLHDIGKPESFTRGADGIGHFYGHPKKSAAVTEAILRRLRYDRATIETVTTLVLNHDLKLNPEPVSVKRLLNQLGETILRQLLPVKAADYSAQNPAFLAPRMVILDDFRAVLDRIIDEAQCFSLKDLAVSGRDLIGVGVPAGGELGHLLGLLLDKVIAGELQNDRALLLEAVRALWQGHEPLGV